MRASRSMRSRSSMELGCVRRARRTRSIRWVGWFSPWRGRCRSGAESSVLPRASSSRCLAPTRDVSSGCGCAGCHRPQTAARAPPVRDGLPESAALRVPPGARMQTPLCRLAQEVAELAGWRRYGLAFLLGVLLAGAWPPVDLTPLIFVAFPGLLWLDEGSRGIWASARLGYVFGFGFFLAGMYWIAAALFVDISSFWWALPFAVLGLPALFALWPAAALLVTALGSGRVRLSPDARLCLFAAAWGGPEWGRGHAFTGLPWNLVGYAWSGGFPGSLYLLQSAAWVGIYALDFVTVLAASLPALFGTPSLVRLSPLWRGMPLPPPAAPRPCARPGG